jgi:hypothetical protein
MIGSAGDSAWVAGRPDEMNPPSRPESRHSSTPTAADNRSPRGQAPNAAAGMGHRGNAHAIGGMPTHPFVEYHLLATKKNGIGIRWRQKDCPERLARRKEFPHQNPVTVTPKQGIHLQRCIPIQITGQAALARSAGMGWFSGRFFGVAEGFGRCCGGCWACLL